MKEIQKKSSSRAFSLVELLVVIAVIGVLSSIMLVNLTTNRIEKEVEGAAFQVAIKIREAQTSALTGRQFIANTVPCSYRVSWSGSQLTTSYVYKDGSGNCTSITTVDAISLIAGMSFTASGSVDFTLPFAQITSSQVLTLQKASISQVVCLGSNGLIEPKATASSC